jgi:type VI secretion system protein ImpJ
VPAATANGSHTRFVAEQRLLHDETTGVDEKPVPLGRKNIGLTLDTESLDGCQSIPLARIRRDHSGHYVYDETFVPPCIQIGGSDRLMTMVQRLIDILDEKSTSLARPKSKSLIEFSTRDVANFWLLHTVNSALTPLRHMYLTKRGHPEELYTEMARLGGALCTFALDSHPRMVPAYDHAQLDRTFELLETHIRTHLETIVPTNCVSIPLHKDADYFYYGTVNDQRCLGPSRWVLAIRSPIGEVELITRTPQLVKVCSNVVGELVKRALPGMPLAHLPIPPSAIAAQLDTQYFAINKGGPCWDHLMQTRQVGVYIPGEIPEPHAEILVILES